jgi:hypothetical protein
MRARTRLTAQQDYAHTKVNGSVARYAEKLAGDDERRC